MRYRNQVLKNATHEIEFRPIYQHYKHTRSFMPDAPYSPRRLQRVVYKIILAVA